jgi:hypothetical protein
MSFLIFHNFSLVITCIHQSSRPMTNGVTTAAHRLESGLVCLARRGTSALSKRRAEELWINDR